MGSYFPNQELNPCPLQRKPRVLTIGLPGKFPQLLLLFVFQMRKLRLREAKWLSQGHTASLEPRFETRQPGTTVHAVGHLGLSVSSDELSKSSLALKDCPAQENTSR